MRRVFVYEYLSGGGADDPADDALRPAGTAMRDAMVADLLELADCAVSSATCPRAPVLPAGAAAVRARDGETPLAFVARQARSHDAVWLVAPETGGLLAQFQQLVDPVRWLGCRHEAIVLATSKRATLDRLAAAGLATPLAFADDPSVRRWVVKPDDGAGALATQVYADRAAAHAASTVRALAGEAVVLEPWVEGEALSLSLMCSDSQAELLSVNRQSIGVDAQGRVSFDGVDVDVLSAGDARRTALARLAVPLVQAIPGLSGFVGVDVVWHAERGPIVIEVNPRVTCAYVGLSAALGRNLAAALLALQVREPLHAVA
jgi:tyramine---L-glutamate ligase